MDQSINERQQLMDEEAMKQPYSDAATIGISSKQLITLLGISGMATITGMTIIVACTDVFKGESIPTSVPPAIYTRNQTFNNALDQALQSDYAKKLNLNTSLAADYATFADNFNKSYDLSNTIELVHRYQQYFNTVQKIDKWNKDPSYKSVYGENNFTDWYYEEKTALLSLNTNSINTSKATKRRLSIEQITAPSVFNKVNGSYAIPHQTLKSIPTKNQGYWCGSCWSFAATSQFETNYYLSGKRCNDSTGGICTFSEQYILDCSNLGNCADGIGSDKWEDVFTPFLTSNGACSKSEYTAYSGKKLMCGKCETPEIKASKFVSIDASKSFEPFAKAASYYGLAFGMWIAEDFYHLASGKADYYSCPETKIGGHAMATVGAFKYQEGSEEKSYVIVRNSWGPFWGNDGYVNLHSSAYKSCWIPGVFQPIFNAFDDTIGHSVNSNGYNQSDNSSHKESGQIPTKAPSHTPTNNPVLPPRTPE